MPQFGTIVLFLLTSPGEVVEGLTADPDCQSAYDSASGSMLINSPCDAAGAATCPTSCKQKLSEVQTACAGKNVEVDVTDQSGNTTKQVQTFASQEVTLIMAFKIFSDKPCKKVLFNEGIAVANSCKKAYQFTAVEIVLSDYCSTSAGGESQTTCHAKCQAALDKVFGTCKNGDVYTDEGDTFNPAAALALQLLGPSSCTYQSVEGAAGASGAARPFLCSVFFAMLATLS